jgi:CRP-like cAMP-binding protein
MGIQIEKLRQHACFRDLPEDQLNGFTKLCSIEMVPPGQILFKEGMPGDYLYLLIQGEIEVFYNIGEGGPVQVDLMCAEEFTGCSALVPPYTYTATTQSHTELEVLKMDAKALRKLMKENCHLGFSIQQHIMRMLMDRIIWFRLGSNSQSRLQY